MKVDEFHGLLRRIDNEFCQISIPKEERFPSFRFNCKLKIYDLENKTLKTINGNTLSVKQFNKLIEIFEDCFDFPNDHHFAKNTHLLENTEFSDFYNRYSKIEKNFVLDSFKGV